MDLPTSRQTCAPPAEDAAELAAALHRALLGTPPDAARLAGLAARIAEAGPAVALRELLATPGYLATLPGRLAAAAPRAAEVEPPPERVVASLGTGRFTAAMLDRAGLPRCDGPFDAAEATPAAVRHCLLTRFEVYLERLQYEPEATIPGDLSSGAGQGRCDHAFYRDRFGVRGMLPHPDAPGAGYADLCRRVEAFREGACGRAPALLLLCTRANDATAGDFRRLARALRAEAPAATLLYIAVSPERASGPMPVLRRSAQLGRHELHQLQAVSDWGSDAFADPVDELALLRLLRIQLLAPG
jgi:hypothetical protein